MNIPRPFLQSPGFWVVCVWIALALLSDLIANDRPLYCKVAGASYFPAFHDRAKPFGHAAMDSIRERDLWATYAYERVVFAPIPFSPTRAARDPLAPSLSPGALHPQRPARFRHWLGTDLYGTDVAAGIVGGARRALLITAPVLAIVLALGLFLGGAAGYWGDYGLRVRIGSLVGVLAALPLGWFWGGALWDFFYEKNMPVAAWLGAGCIACGVWATGAGLARAPGLRKEIALPLDLMIMRVVEAFYSLPRMMMLIAVMALFTRFQFGALALTVGVLSWTGVAMLARNEMLRIREMPYVSAAQGLGLSRFRILIRHILPNALPPIYVTLALGASGIILLEASLSFLGLSGDVKGDASWGAMLARAKLRYTDWWAAAFPGLAIAIVTLSLYEIGERLRNWQHER